MLSNYERYVAMTKDEWKLAGIIPASLSRNHDDLWSVLERMATIRSSWYRTKLAVCQIDSAKMADSQN